MDGNSAIATAGDASVNLAIFVLGSSPVNLGNNNLYATVYAPLSTVTMTGNADLFGGIIGFPRTDPDERQQCDRL